jgi:hypothetical protein
MEYVHLWRRISTGPVLGFISPRNNLWLESVFPGGWDMRIAFGGIRCNQKSDIILIPSYLQSLCSEDDINCEAMILIPKTGGKGIL